MNIKGVVIKPLAEQQDIDQMFIDPTGVEFDEKAYLPVWDNFQYDKPPLGYVQISRAEDGSLMAEGLLFDEHWRKLIETPDENTGGLTFAAGIATTDRTEDRGGRGEILSSYLRAVSLTWRHTDPAQPAVEYPE